MIYTNKPAATVHCDDNTVLYCYYYKRYFYWHSTVVLLCYFFLRTVKPLRPFDFPWRYFCSFSPQFVPRLATEYTNLHVVARKTFGFFFATTRQVVGPLRAFFSCGWQGIPPWKDGSPSILTICVTLIYSSNMSEAIADFAVFSVPAGYWCDSIMQVK